MKNSGTIFGIILSAALSSTSSAQAFTNFVRQVQVNSNAEMEVGVGQTGERLSPLEINPGGARFELWTVEGSTLTSYLLDQRYVGAYVPQAEVTIVSEDPYRTRPRTRADRPYQVTLGLAGMLSDPSSPDASRMVNLHHYVQNYGASGTGVGMDPSTADLESTATINVNGEQVMEFSTHSVPATSLNKARGEERFMVESLSDYQAPPAQLAAASIQIWPVADGSISGVSEGDSLRFVAPDITVSLNDLYPDSLTYAQVYPGAPALGTIGTVVPASAIVINGAVPENRVLVLDQWDSVIDESGVWTMELLTETPFGVDRLTYLSFTINRDMEVNGTVTTVE